jgi:hypothetical protein
MRRVRVAVFPGLSLVTPKAPVQIFASVIHGILITT